jgi:hypothetical protein
MKKILLIILFSFSMFTWVDGQISIVGGGPTVTENFDGIGTSATATLPTNWKADKLTTVRTVGTYAAAGTATTVSGGNGMTSSASNGIYNYGAGPASTATDRAVGGLSSSSASKTVNVYAWLSNTGASSITSFTISYDVEKYRMGTNAAGFSIQMYYSSDGSVWTNAGSSFLTSFAADATTDGYASAPGATVNVVGQTLTVTVPASGSIYLAWSYSVTSGSTTSFSQGLGIDNVSISASSSGSNPPTQLVITSVNGGISPDSNTPFSVVVQAQDNGGTPRNVEVNTSVTLSVATGTGVLGGTLTLPILAGSNVVTFPGITYSVAEAGVSILASTTGLTPGTSSLFAVLLPANHLAFVGVPAIGYSGTSLSSFTVEARRPDNSVDLNYYDSIFIAKETGPGLISGTLHKKSTQGIGTFNNVVFSTPGDYTLNTTSGLLTQDVTGTISIQQGPTLTELVVPKYFGCKTASGTNNARTVFALCLKIDYLTPNTAYDLKVGLALTSEASTSFGAGNVWKPVDKFGGTNTSTIPSAFTTDVNGSSGTVWVFFQPTGNSTRFDAGQVHNLRVGYVIAGGSIPTSPNFVGTKTLTALDDAPATPRTTATTDDGAFLHGTASTAVSGKYVLLFDNVDGTGDPLFSYQVRTAIPTSGVSSDLPTIIDSIYTQGLTSVIGDYPAVIPIGANNPNGVRRIESRNADNTIFGFNTSSDGVWPNGSNTTTIARRDVLDIDSVSAPLTPASVKSLHLKLFMEGFFDNSLSMMTKAQDVTPDGSSTFDKWTGTIADTLSVLLVQDLGPSWPDPIPYDYQAHAVPVNTDGTIVLPSIPSSLSASYYIVIKHRQSVETWSASAVSFSSSTINYDFTTAASQAYGSNQKKVSTGSEIYGFYGGDITSMAGPQDGYVDIFDNNDIFNQAQLSAYGYMLEDITSMTGGPDGYIDIFDMALVFNNMQVSVGMNTPPYPMKKSIHHNSITPK